MEPQMTGADDRTYIEEVVRKYRPELDRLMPYLPWLEEKLGAETRKTFDSEGVAEHSVTFPVYDSTLMSFVNTANATSFMNYNYVYTYSRLRVKTTEEEYHMIQSCELLADLPVLTDVLSKYVLKGMTKGNVWTEGVRNGAFYHAVKKMDEILRKYS